MRGIFVMQGGGGDMNIGGVFTAVATHGGFEMKMDIIMASHLTANCVL